MTYWVLKAILTPILRFFFRVRVEGLENVPADGPAILASNHLSFSDSVFLPLVVRRRVTFVAKAEYFEDPKTAWIFRALGQIPIKRGGGSASRRALESAAEVLEAGGPWRRPPRCWRPGGFSASIPRAPARPTAASTKATPGWPGWLCRPAPRC